MSRFLYIFLIIYSFNAFSFPENLMIGFINGAKSSISTSDWCKVQCLMGSHLNEAYYTTRHILNPLFDKQINEKIESLGSRELREQSLQWENMLENIEYIWSDEIKQRYDGKVSFAKTLSALNYLNIIHYKIEDKI